MSTIKDNKFNSESDASLVRKLTTEKVKLAELEPGNPSHVQAAFEYFKQMPSRMKVEKDEVSLKFIQKVLEKHYKYFVYLSEDQYNDKNCNLFLEQILKETATTKKGVTLEVFKSYENKLVISLLYKTCKGEEVYYFDNELKVPVSLMSSFKISLKIEDSKQFIKMLDTSVEQLCAPVVYNKIMHIINTSYRASLLDLVGKTDSGYYKLTNSIGKLEEIVSKDISSKFTNKCVVVNDFVISSVEIDRGTKDIIEDEFFELRRKRLNIDEELKYQKESLDLFTKKVEILSKHPQIKETLTEAEKDKAFQRYMLKTSPTKEKPLRKSSNLEDRELEQMNGGIVKEEDKVVVVKKDKILNIVTTAIFCLTGLISFIAGVVNQANGIYGSLLVALGIALIVCGITLLVKRIIRYKRGSDVLNEDVVVEEENDNE